MYFARCNLILSDLHREAGDLAQDEAMVVLAHDWTVARDAREVLCRAARIQTRIELVKAFQPGTEANEGHKDHPEEAFIPFVSFYSSILSEDRNAKCL